MEGIADTRSYTLIVMYQFSVPWSASLLLNWLIFISDMIPLKKEQ